MSDETRELTEEEKEAMRIINEEIDRRTEYRIIGFGIGTAIFSALTLFGKWAIKRIKEKHQEKV